MTQPSAGATRAELPDPLTSRAVLIGVSRYQELDPLPAVANNIDSMEAIFTDRDIWGLPKSHCRVLKDPTTIDEVLDAVHRAATEATDALVVYYAGHGIPDEKADLYLALPDSAPDRLYKAVRYDDVRREVVTTAGKCRAKVVILDCCYSGRAMLGGMSGPAQIADHARIDGTYLMTASAETSQALAPIGEKFTAFTGAIVAALSNGLPEGPDLLDMETLYWHVRSELEAKRFPIPQQRTRNDGKEIALARNRRGQSPGAAPEVHPAWEPPEAPLGFERAVKTRPRDFVAEVRKLLDGGSQGVANQLLEATGGRRDPQEAATLIGLMTDVGMDASKRTFVNVVIKRPPSEIVTVLQTLNELGSLEDASSLLEAGSAGPLDNIVGLAASLRDASMPAELERLLDLAADAVARTGGIISLVGALSSAGMRAETDLMLGNTAARLSGVDAVSLADSLRAAGRDDAAFRLYAGAVTALLGRPPADVVQLISAMRTGERHADADAVVLAFARAQPIPEARLAFIEALLSANLSSDVDRVLDDAAKTSDENAITSLAGDLRDLDLQNLAYHLLVEASKHRPLVRSLTLVNALREAGRPLEANSLLDELVRSAPALDVAELIEALRRRNSDTDAERVISAARLTHILRIDQIEEALYGASDDHELGWLLEMAAQQPTEQIVKWLDQVRIGGNRSLQRRVIEAIGTYANLSTITELCEYTNRIGRESEGVALVAAASRARTSEEISQLAERLRSMGLHLYTRSLPFDRIAWPWRRGRTGA